MIQNPKCELCKQSLDGCTWTSDSIKYHNLIEQFRGLRLCESCAFRLSKTKEFEIWLSMRKKDGKEVKQ